MAPDTLDRIVFGWLIRIGSGYIESGLVATIRSNRIGLELALSDRAGTGWGRSGIAGTCHIRSNLVRLG